MVQLRFRPGPNAKPFKRLNVVYVGPTLTMSLHYGTASGSDRVIDSTLKTDLGLLILSLT